MFRNFLGHITADALVPEQLAHYVQAVSGRRGVLCGPFVAYVHGADAVLVAYTQSAASNPSPAPEAGSFYRAASPEEEGALSLALTRLRAEHGCTRVTVLAPYRPAEAPESAPSASDYYWQLPLPAPAPGQKLRNLLTRARRDLAVASQAWGSDCEALVRHTLNTRPLAPGTRAIYAALAHYAGEGAGSGGPFSSVFLYTARLGDGTLAGFTIGDFSSLHTAFYMFAFRSSFAPPGTADLLLECLVRHAESLGQARLNLGLGINPGITFFKKKWGAVPFLPCLETSWALSPPKPGLLCSFRALWKH